MKKQPNNGELKTLRKLLSVSVETAVEVLEKRGPLAFINNAFTFVGLGGDLEELKEEVLYVQAHPQIVNTILKEEVKKHGRHEEEIILKTVRKVYAAIIYNVSTGLSIGEDWKGYNN